MRLVVDSEKQAKEKNIDWRDFPMFNLETGKRLKKTCGDIYDSWKEYVEKYPDDHSYTEWNEEQKYLGGRPAIQDDRKKKSYATKIRPDQIRFLKSQYKAASLLETLIDREIERQGWKEAD